MPTWTSNIPSQVKTFANLASFPAAGSVKTIYIAEDTDIAYYWTGSAYVALSIQDLSGYVQNSDFSSHSILAQQSGSGSPVAVTIGTNEILGRLSGGGANIKGLSASEVKGLLDLSGTNTGDETQSSILSKLGWWKVLDTTDSATHTGVSTETIIKAVELPALTNGSELKINALRVKKAGVALCTIKAYINNVNNNLSGAVQLLTTASAFANSGLIATIERTFKIASGNIKGISSASGVFTDKGQNTSTPLNASLPDGTLYLIVTLTQAVGESSVVELIDVSNF